jgi:limonene-1,2-epoxide hydrolase
MTRTPEEAVRGLWAVLDERDYDGIADWVTDDCIYYDVPLGPAFSARGPVDIAKRLRVGWGELTAYENHDGLLVAGPGEQEAVVMYEHSETWTFRTGEVLHLPFATVHKVRDGRVSLWRDYWDYNALTAAAPQEWQDGLLSADTSWLFDATGQV